MVQFADTLQGIDTFSTCPAQIIGLFKYESRGIPTPELIDKNLSLADRATIANMAPEYGGIIIY